MCSGERVARVRFESEETADGARVLAGDAPGPGVDAAEPNRHGLSYATSIRDILFHLASHGAYHRGQVSVTLRHSNLEPVNTDYITFVRDLAGEPWKP